MKLAKKSGMTIAAAAAAMLVGGAVLAPATAIAADKGKCYGVNACKGQSACKTANSACKGQNACKGQGFLTMTKAECAKKGGKFES